MILALAVMGTLGGRQAAGSVPADPQIDLFVAKCASCHTVGKGDRVGPDLKDVVGRRDRAWLERFIQTPSSLLDSDPAARALLQEWKGVRMPDLGLDAGQVRALVELVERCSAEPCELVGNFVSVREAQPEHIALGRALFFGEAPIVSGAAPCAACHQVAVGASGGGIGGGTLAKDLTFAFARLGDEGLDAALRNPAFPVMNKVFADRPLDQNEVFALRAFLYETNRSGGAPVSGPSLPLAALLLSALALALLNGFWSRRLLGVRSTVKARKGCPL